jgi:arsenite methyltransferase
MTDAMLARRNVGGARVVKVHLLKSVIEEIPLPADSVDVVISNCVQPLGRQGEGADRDRACAPARWADRDHRCLSPRTGSLRTSGPSFAGCIAGALSTGEYEAGLDAAGFDQVSVEFTHEVADGMHGAIIRAVKTSEPESRRLPVIQAAAGAGCC